MWYPTVPMEVLCKEYIDLLCDYFRNCKADLKSETFRKCVDSHLAGWFPTMMAQNVYAFREHMSLKYVLVQATIEPVKRLKNITNGTKSKML